MRPTAAASDAGRGAGVALCLLSAVGFGLMAIFAKGAYGAGLGVTALLAARFALAAGLFWALVAARGRTRHRRAWPPRRVVSSCLALGAIGYAAQAGLFFSALRHIDASLTSLLLYTYPALVFCGAVALRREQVTTWKVLWLALASAGVAMVLLAGGTRDVESAGIALALAAGACYAVYILVAESVVRRIDPLLLGALVTSGAAATFTIAGAAGGGLAIPAAGWPWIVAIASLSTVLPIVTFMLGMERVGASTASIVSTVEPVVTVSLAIALYGEALGPWQALGGALVLAAVLALRARSGHAVACRDDGPPALRAPAPGELHPARP